MLCRRRIGYELALLTAAWLFERRVAGARLTVVTPERAPLAAFGARASDTLAELLDRHDVELRCAVSPRAVREGALVLGDGGTVAGERVVALARLVGPALPGLPADADGSCRSMSTAGCRAWGTSMRRAP